MVKLATYGSLRKGDYNFERYKDAFDEEIKYIETVKVDGYELFSLREYPACIEGEGEILVDILEVSDRVATKIKRMEVGAGYEEQVVNINDEDHLIYLFNEEPKYHEGKVEHGDWLKFKNI